MSAADFNDHDLTRVTSDRKEVHVPTMSTIVAAIPSNAMENVMTVLKNDSSGISAAESGESQEIIDASDLTRDHWVQVL